MIFILLTFYLVFAKLSYSIDEFSVAQQITYTVNRSGNAKVVQEVNLTNNISQIYAKDYQINLTNSEIQNLRSYDKYGDIVNTVNTTGENTSVSLKFSQPTIGKGQTNQFYITYSISSFAKKKGNTYEIQFPVFGNTFDKQKINLSLIVPTSFGELSFSSIPIDSSHIVNDTLQISFNQNQTKNKTLLVFGNSQLFDFKLNYFIENKEATTINTEIPIPPDTNSQTIIYKQIEPLPQSVKTDVNGNWLAQYTLNPNQKLEVTATGQAQIHPSTEQISILTDQKFTSSSQYWPVADPQILSISQNFKSPKEIYKYVVETLGYNYSGLETAKRKGASEALLNPKESLCTEFTDLFVTLARSINIPAREIEGYAYSNNPKIKPINPNSDILHAWPEYYNFSTKTWTQIDPTWENTTNGIDYFTDLDLNHLAFVIHGTDSVYPPPPGSYKKDKFTKSIFIDFATENYQPAYLAPSININGSTLSIKNQNLFAIKPLTIKIPNLNWEIKINSLAPLSFTNINLPPVPFWKMVLPKFSYYQLTIETVDNQTPINLKIINRQHYLFLSITIGIIVFILCASGIILTAGSKKHEKNS